MSLRALERLNAALDGRYRIEREVGRGGMAVVYLAHDEKHGRSVALKVLRPELAEAMGAARFAREIEIAARLNHPNILALHDSGEADGLLYFVMPYIDGESLRDRLDREETLPLDEAIRIANEVADALGYAHGQGLIHRDIKPENVLFQAGHAVVCDFGIAKAVSEARDDLTRTGTSVGTLAYMSPEQLSDGTAIDQRADLYALACMLHEMLDGAVPFKASTPQASVAKKLTGDLPSPPEGDTVPVTVRDVIRRSLETRAEGRFDSAEAFAAALKHARTRAAVEAEERRRQRAGLFRTLGTVAALLALGAVGWWGTSIVSGPEVELMAVLPFANAANDPTQDYFVAGLHDELVKELQRSGMRVINSTSVRRYSSSETPVDDVVADFGVDGILQGSGRLDGRQIVVDLQLIDAITHEVLWNRSFDAAEREVLALIRSMTRSVAEEVGLPLDEATLIRLAEAPEVDEVLYELLLQARHEQYTLSAEGLDRAEALYELALERDSTSTEALTGLAGVWGIRGQQGMITAEQAGAQSDPLWARAEALDPELGGDQSARALRLTWPLWPEGRWTEAEQAFLAHLQAEPSDSRIRAYYAQLLLYLGRADEAAAQAERAAVQAQDDMLVQGLYGQTLNGLDRWEEAENVLVRARRFDAESAHVQSTLRTIYHLRGKYDASIPVWRDSYRSRGDLEALEALNEGYARGGYREALSSVAALFQDRSEAGDTTVSMWQIGTLHTRAGNHDAALDYLEVAVDEGDYNAPYLIFDGIFDPLRSDPRFQVLIDRLGFPD